MSCSLQDNCDNDNADDAKIYSSHFFTIDKLLSMKMQKAYTKTGCKSNENSIDEIKVKCPKEEGCVLYGQSIIPVVQSGGIKAVAMATPGTTLFLPFVDVAESSSTTKKSYHQCHKE